MFEIDQGEANQQAQYDWLHERYGNCRENKTYRHHYVNLLA